MTFWTDERVTELRGHWEAGLTGGEIERAMGAPSRNVIVGKLYRLGLTRDDHILADRVNRVRRGIAAAKQAPRKPRQARPRPPAVINAPPTQPAPPPAAGPSDAYRCGLLELTTESCRFVVSGDGAPFVFCGTPEADFPALSYCRFHARIVYRRPGEREEAA